MIADTHFQIVLRQCEIHIYRRICVLVGIGDDVPDDLRHSLAVDIYDNGRQFAHDCMMLIVTAFHQFRKHSRIFVVTVHLEFSQIVKGGGKQVADK